MTENDITQRNRQRMVERQLAGRGITHQGVLDAMRTVPRHLFVPPEHRYMAYSDGPLPIGKEQTISQPYIVALMTQLLDPQPHHLALEVGAGSGYQAAVLSRLVKHVHTVERHTPLAENAQQTLTDVGYANVTLHVGDGSLGWPQDAPYDAIIVTAAAPEVPPPLLEQLAEGGRLVLPVGGRGFQVLQRWTRTGGTFDHEDLAPVAFVPLLGEYGW